MTNAKSKHLKFSQVLYSNSMFSYFLATLILVNGLPPLVLPQHLLNYNPETHENDIALVQLDKEVTFNRYIHTVCLPEANQAISTGSTAYVTGWGSQSYSGKSLRKNKNKDNSNISWYLPLCTFFLIKGHLKGRFYRENHPTV